jgi:hypothetical protein
MNPMPAIHIINVRHSCGSYTARIVGRGITASCTMSAEAAAERACVKCHTGEKNPPYTVTPASLGITLTKLTDSISLSTYQATWQTPSVP